MDRERDIYGNPIYSQEEYEHFCFAQIPFTGYVEGIGYACTEVVVTARIYNQSNSEFVYDINEITLFWSEIDVFTGFRSTTIGLGTSLSYLSNNNVSTRGKFSGATKGTSYASLTFRNSPLAKIPVSDGSIIKKMPPRMPLYPGGKPIPFMGPTMKNWGQVAGRATPFIGRTFIVVGVASSAYNIHSSGYNAKVITKEAGGWTGAIAGAKGGAVLGGIVGAWFGGAGAAPGAFIGGVIGGILGYWGGSEAAGGVYDMID